MSSQGKTLSLEALLTFEVFLDDFFDLESLVSLPALTLDSFFFTEGRLSSFPLLLFAFLDLAFSMDFLSTSDLFFASFLIGLLSPFFFDFF
jgi:hypothetical protein